jgi:flagellar hook-length control protein FliK
MNNGNLLSSLLGATGTGSAAPKSTARKTRADTTEKFQQAFEQARPEVAARKPAARNDIDRQRTGQRDISAKAESPHQRTNPADNKKPVKPTPIQTEKTSEATSAEKSSQHTSTASQKERVEDATGEHIVASGLGELSPDTAIVVAVPLAIAPANGNQDGLTEALLSDLDEIAPDLLLGDGTEESVEEGDGEGSDLLASLDTPPVAAPGTPLSDAEIQDADLALIGANLKAVGANSLNPTGQNPLAANSQAVTTGMATSGALLMDEVLPNASSATSSAEGSSANKTANSEALNLGDNPDFALLDSKTTFNKMMEASLVSQDKAAPVIDLAKPATTPNSVLEALARPLESQSPAARAFIVQTGVPVTVGSPQWSQAVGDKVLWLAAQNVSAAEIRLDPPELGPMQVKVTVNQDQASVTFTSHNPVVREVLDQQLNRLREMFSEQGLNLVNVDVSDKSFAQQERDQEESGQSRANANIEDDELTPVAQTSIASVRLVDHYA